MGIWVIVCFVGGILNLGMVGVSILFYRKNYLKETALACLLLTELFLFFICTVIGLCLGFFAR